MDSQILSNGSLGKICSELCSPLRDRGPGQVCLARSSSPDPAKRKSPLHLCGENRFGFTLLEILIAMFIFAIVLSTIYTSYTGTFRIIDETEYQADIYTMARIALERMQEDLESVYIPLKGEKAPESDETPADDQESGFIGEDNEIEGRSTDSLRFTSRAHLDFGEQEQSSGAAEIGYYVEKHDEEEGFVLYRTDTPTLQERPEEGTGGLVLCDSLRSVNFTYYDSDREEYDNWDSTGAPKMVSIILEFENIADPEMPFKFFTRVALPMAQG